MNQKMKILCLLLAGLLLMSVLVGCGLGELPGLNQETTVNGGEASTDPTEDALNELREEVDWGGNDFGILYVNDIGGYTEEVEAEANAGATQTASAVINDAVYERNTLFEDYCNLKFVLIPVSNSAVQSSVQAEVQTGSGDFHLITQTTSGTAATATSGALYNYLDLDIDYNKEWWDAGTLDFALNGHVYFMNGPYNIVDDDVTFVMMFNKDLREEYQLPDLYQTVKNMDWTMDYFNSVISELATENGDGRWDEKDIYGFSCPGSIGDTFFYGAGLRYIQNSPDMDMPELVLADKMEVALDVLAIARSIVHDNNSSYVAAAGSEALSRDVFVEGRSLFYCEAANYLRYLNANMDSQYGVVPIPKYNKAQEKYTTWSHSIGSTLSIPTTVARGGSDLDQFANVLEVYTILSQRLVRPAYYDTVLTTRNVHDAESAEMLNLIFANRTYDMAIYFADLGYASIFANAVSSSGDNFSSKYSSVSKNFNGKIGRLLKKLSS